MNKQEYQTFGSVKIHSVMIDRIRTALGRIGITARIVYMDSDAYEVWRKEEDLKDDEASRATWAGLQL